MAYLKIWPNSAHVYEYSIINYRFNLVKYFTKYNIGYWVSRFTCVPVCPQ